jgi:hypothetical protein
VLVRVLELGLGRAVELDRDLLNDVGVLALEAGADRGPAGRARDEELILAEWRDLLRVVEELLVEARPPYVVAGASR